MDNQEKTLASDYNFRKPILELHSVKIKNHLYCIADIENLQIISVNEIENIIEFEASAKLHFREKNGNGYISPGGTLSFTGKVKKTDNLYYLSENVTLKEEINCMNYKVCDDNELSY